MAIKKLPWLRMLKKTDPEPPVRLPIAAGAISNGEGWWPDTDRKKLIRKLVLEKAEEVSRKEGIDRREFLASSCGMATTLYMINLVNGCSGGKGKPDNRLGMDGSSGSGGGGNGPGGGGSGSGASGGGSGTSGSTTGSSGMGAAGSGSGGMGNPGGGTGGFEIPPEAMTDGGMADLCMGNGGNELIIDMQSHFANNETNPFGATLLNSFISQITPERYPWIKRTAGCTGPACYDRMEYVNQIFMGSDTTIGVLSGISYGLGDGGVGGLAVLTNEDLLDGAMKLEADFPGRMLTHCMVMPNDRKTIQFEMMDRLANSYSNWKTYPPWAPGGGTGYYLDQDVGPEMIARGIALGSPIFCIHKGFPLNGFSAPHCDPKDVTGAAAMFPDARLVIYHSAFENGLAAGQTSAAGVGATADVGWGAGVGQWPEGAYDEALEADMAAATTTAMGSYPLNRGVNSLIWALRKAGIGRNGVYNDGSKPAVYIYAECGGVWPALMMGRAEEAQHYWGKLLKYVGEDRMVWGTDCLWFGSPQPLIEAFRSFQISQEFMDTYGYPQLTQQAKEKILGQNAALIQNVRTGVNISGCHSDYVGMAAVRERREYDLEFGRRRDMMADVWAPKTRREFFQLVREENVEKTRFSGNFPDRPQGRPEVRNRRG